MSQKESRRVYVMEMVVNGSLTAKQAAELLGLSTRQIGRLKKGLTTTGIEALAHKSRGRKPSHALTADTKQTICHLASGPLQGTSCTHVAELLAEHYGITVSDRTVRRILTEAGISYGRYRLAKRRRLRSRMPRPGMLVQLDASPFDWLEDRGPHLHLHGAIDDATSTVLMLHFEPQETIRGYLFTLAGIIRDYGVPRAVYTDLHSMFISPAQAKLTIEDELAGKRANLTQLGRVFGSLGINHIPARSPQAKGRVERLWRTLQQRLFVELRLANINTLEQANAFLPAFVARHNARFACLPEQTDSAFAPAPDHDALMRTLAWHTTRKTTKDSTVSYLGCTYLLLNSDGLQASFTPGSTITGIVHLDGALSALHRDKPYRLQPAPRMIRAATVPIHTPKQTATPHKHSNDHPWKQPWTKRSRPRLDPAERYFLEQDHCEPDPYAFVYPHLE